MMMISGRREFSAMKNEDELQGGEIEKHEICKIRGRDRETNRETEGESDGRRRKI